MLKAGAGERLQQLEAAILATVMSRDGRTVAKRPAVNPSGELTDSDEIAIREAMVRDYSTLVSIVVQGGIWPALETMLLEHRLREMG